MFFSHNNSLHSLSNILEIERSGNVFPGSKEIVSLHYINGVIKSLTFHDNEEANNFCEELHQVMLERNLLLPLYDSSFLRRPEEQEENTQMEIPFP
jgi:hypothetical protein